MVGDHEHIKNLERRIEVLEKTAARLLLSVKVEKAEDKESIEDDPVRCGICQEAISPIKLSTPKAISDWDKERPAERAREISFNHCGRTWLIGTNGEPLDCGPEEF
jgi:hypothetical protein